jgi:hypothetical protein
MGGTIPNWKQYADSLRLQHQRLALRYRYSLPHLTLGMLSRHLTARQKTLLVALLWVLLAESRIEGKPTHHFSPETCNCG